MLNQMVVDAEHGTVDSPLHPDQVRVDPEVPHALRRLTDAGFGLAIVSNQPASAKGKTSRENLDRAHARVLELIQSQGGRVLKSYICYHRSEDKCKCRKPATGLLEQALKDHPQYAARGNWMVGDGVTDVQAGRVFGARTAFVGAFKVETERIFEKVGVQPDIWVNNLDEFVDVIMKQGKERAPMAENFTEAYLAESAAIAQKLDRGSIEAVCEGLAELQKKGGRLFILGVGGSAGHASHAVNDFRKICGIESYTPTDNVSEMTARINDEGWDTCFSNWLEGSRLSARDGVLVFSVGGGNREKNVSVNLVKALELAKSKGAKIFGIVGKDGGTTAQLADACVLIPVMSSERITPHTEGFCAVVWHLIVSHPKLKTAATKWESVSLATPAKR